MSGFEIEKQTRRTQPLSIMAPFSRPVVQVPQCTTFLHHLQRRPASQPITGNKISTIKWPAEKKNFSLSTEHMPHTGFPLNFPPLSRQKRALFKFGLLPFRGHIYL